jgi:hypothetical protein
MYLVVPNYTVKLGYSNIGFCDTLSIASNIEWYALIPHKAYSFITTLFLGPFDDVITKFYCILLRVRISATVINCGFPIYWILIIIHFTN